LLTAGITVGVIRTNPVWVWGEKGVSIAGVWILIIWILELVAYIILAKIEDLHLRSKYGKVHVEYAQHVPFMIP
jgi:protein-S-isoprenylcysteine O-methyltransferase Ste14